MRKRTNQVYQYILEQGYEIEVRFFGQTEATAYLLKDGTRCHLARFKRNNQSIEYTRRIIKVAQAKSHAENALLELKNWIDSGQTISPEIRSVTSKSDKLKNLLSYLQAIIEEDKKPTWIEIGQKADLTASQAQSRYRHLKPVIDAVIQAHKATNQ